MESIRLRDYVRDIPDFPKSGIVFKDITPLLADGDAFSATISELACFVPNDTDIIVGIESRGFLFGAALAQQTGLGFVPVRKPGKLPAEVHGIDYELEYGMDRLEIHRDALSEGHKVLIVDDLLATGGTARATVDLVRHLGGEVAACLFVIELGFLKGRKLLQDVNVHSLIQY
ncbi:MAG TPA: adenine phosphoribosyltransferase [Mariprofundaceae bacterium]|nr:adenine phosphoribosyltransferase [Mariprofundaceae bacterium]